MLRPRPLLAVGLTTCALHLQLLSLAVSSSNFEVTHVGICGDMGGLWTAQPVLLRTDWTIVINPSTNRLWRPRDRTTLKRQSVHDPITTQTGSFVFSSLSCPLQFA